MHDITHMFPKINNYKAKIFQHFGIIHYFTQGACSRVDYGKSKLKTIVWCEHCKISKRDTVFWILKYGEYLPRMMDEL